MYFFTLNKYFFVLYLIFLCVSCADKDDEGGEAYVELQSEEVLFESKGGSIELQFKTSGSWMAVPYHTKGNWCSIDKNGGGKGSAVLVISAKENELYDERNTAIQIRCGEITRMITVTQKQKDAILLSSDKVEIGQEGGECYFTVNANVDYECMVESGSDWISVVEIPQTKGLDTCSFSLKINPNLTFEKRLGIVMIKAGTLSERINVFQTGSVPTLVLSENEHIAKSSGDTVKVEVTSNCDYSFQLPDVGWITETDYSGQSAFTHFFAIEPNFTSKPRSVTIIFKNKYNGKTESIVITQLPKNAITTARSEYNFNSARNEVLLRLNSNVKFDVDVPADWVHLSFKDTSDSLRFYDISMVVDENMTGVSREVYVSFYTVELVQRVIVRQDGRSDHMKVVISHKSSYFETAVSGGKIFGLMDWGDGSRDELKTTNNHSYSDVAERFVTIDCWGASSFALPSLTNVSSVAIYVNRDYDGSTEDFVVQHRDWDK